MDRKKVSPLDLVDAPPRSFELGGAAASLYDIFAAGGLLFFKFLIGTRRAGRPLLRNSRVIAGGGLVLGSFAGLLGGTMMSFDFYKGHDYWTADYFWGPFFGFGAAGLIVGGIGAAILLSYVDALRNEAFHEFWLSELQEGHVEKLEAEVDALGWSQKSRYYHEFFTAIGRGQEVTDAHAAALRRCSSISPARRASSG